MAAGIVNEAVGEVRRQEVKSEPLLYKARYARSGYRPRLMLRLSSANSSDCFLIAFSCRMA
jgi:hypothetical protein